MAGTATHLAIADRMYSILGGEVIKNAPLFYGGNIAPDAVHAKKDYQRADKKRSHLCDGIRSYGYGYPEVARLFKDRVDGFIRNYILTAGEDRDLYLGYAVHLLVDEFYLLEIYRLLEERLKGGGADPDAPGFRRNLADEVNNDGYENFFRETSDAYDITVHEYEFEHNVAHILDAAWDYGVRDHVAAAEINAFKRRAIDKFSASESERINKNLAAAVSFIDRAAADTIVRLGGIV